MNPRHHLLALVLGCLLALLGTTIALTHWAARSLHEEVVAQRDHYLLHSLRTAAENYLAIGLNLDQMEALQGLIERERAGFAQVLAIDVFAASGTLLYSTDPPTVGTQVPNSWRQGLAQNTPWHSEQPGQRQRGVRFDNDLGQAAGGIVLTLSTAPAPVTLAQWKTRGQQALQVLGLAALAGLAAWAGVALGLRRLLAPFDRVAHILQGHAPSTPDTHTTPLQQAAHRTQAHWAAAHQRTQDSLRQLQELDDAP